MYHFPVYLPEFSNREDLLLTVSVFDDDTGQPIDLSGRTLGQAGDYTTNQWIITDGPIITSSQSVLTIPDYPIGSQLTAVTLVVDPGLNILPGDPITIANLPGGAVVIGPTGPPPLPLIGEGPGTDYLITEDSPPSPIVPPIVANAGPNSMTGYVSSYTASSGVLVVQIGCTFQFEIRLLKPTEGNRDGYAIWYDFGTYPDHGPLITASLGNGLTIVDVGVLQIRIPETTLRRLRHRSYGASLTMTDSHDTRQIFVARLPMQYGGVTI